MSALDGAEGHVAKNNDMAEEWGAEEIALQSMEGRPLPFDAADFVRAARLKADQAAPLRYPRFAPPPGWEPPHQQFDRYAIDSQPDDPNDVAGWARWLRALDEQDSSNSYLKFCWKHGDDRKMRRVLLRLATSMGLPTGLCAAMGLIPLRQQCGACARQAGRPCRNYAGPNGRCRFHGGRSRPPRGNKNGQTHGRYSIEARRERYAEKQKAREVASGASEGSVAEDRSGEV